jgi:hypothetical protein
VTTTINASTSSGLVNTADTSGILQLQTASTAALTIDASQNVGVGVTTPAYKLEARGELAASNGTYGTILTYSVGNQTGILGTYGNHGLEFRTNNTDRMRIDASGNVGIGTSTPQTRLNLWSSSARGEVISNAYPTLMLDNTSTPAQFYITQPTADVYFSNQSSSGALIYNTNNTERMRIDSSGNVLVGATTPYSGTVSNVTATTGVDIGSSSTATSKQLQFIRNGSTGTAGNIYATAGSFSNYCGIEFVIENVGGGSQSGYLKFNTTSSATSAERARIDSGGNFQVGGQYAVPPTTSFGRIVSSGIFQSGRTGTGSQPAAEFFNGNSNVGSIYTSGSNTSYNTSSDYRLKENIAPITGALTKVALLKPSTYKWKVDGANGEGFIAHELAEVFPQAVTGEKDEVDEDDKPKYQSIDTSFLVATLTAAIQELKAINDTQAETINALTARIVALEK